MEDRAHVAHILFKTVGKTDAEVEEIRKKAEDVLKKAKSGGNFGDLAKMYSEDTTKDKGGDLDWIVRGQTVPEFEMAAFSLPKGRISDLVKTQYGFHIIKVIDRETAHTRPLTKCGRRFWKCLQQQKAEQWPTILSNRLPIRFAASGRVHIDDLGKNYGLTVKTPSRWSPASRFCSWAIRRKSPTPITRCEGRPELADPHRPWLRGSIHQAGRAGHPGTLAEVRDKVLMDYKHEKAVELAKSRAEDLGSR